MKISELPKEYRVLAEKRRDYFGINPRSDEIVLAFDLPKTPEGKCFWGKVRVARKIDELPPIPEATQ